MKSFNKANTARSPETLGFRVCVLRLPRRLRGLGKVRPCQTVTFHGDILRQQRNSLSSNSMLVRRPDQYQQCDQSR